MRLAGVILLLALPFSMSVYGCAAPSDGLEDESTEDALVSSCTLGADKCKTSAQILAARSFKDRRPPERRRSDIEITVQHPAHERVPRVFRSHTTRSLRWDGSGRWTLAGDAAGQTPLVVDDAVLIEVLDASTGELLEAGAITIAPEFHVVLAGKPVRELARAVTVEVGIGATFDAGDADVTPLLPKDRPFKLRVSALDVAGLAVVSNVFLTSVAAAPPPPADPFDVATCADPPMTREEALSLFAPGATSAPLGSLTWWARKRTCNALTGCGPWQPSARETFTMKSNSSQGGASDIGVDLPLAATLKLYVATYFDSREDAWKKRLELEMSTAPIAFGWRGTTYREPFSASCDLWSGARISPWGRCTPTFAGGRAVAIGPVPRDPDVDGMTAFSGKVARHCAYLRQARTVDGIDYELVASGRY